jgi:hypothetical protein
MSTDLTAQRNVVVPPMRHEIQLQVHHLVESLIHGDSNLEIPLDVGSLNPRFSMFVYLGLILLNVSVRGEGVATDLFTNSLTLIEIVPFE